MEYKGTADCGGGCRVDLCCDEGMDKKIRTGESYL